MDFIRQYDEVTANEYSNRIAEFAAFSPANAQVVFLGDSITAIMKSDDMFETRTFNRGIGGDTIEGVMARLDRIAQMGPKKLFVLIGINSIAFGYKIDGEEGLCDQYCRLFESIKSKMPDSEVFIQSVLPTNAGYRPDLPNSIIMEVDLVLKELCRRFGFYYLDFYSEFLDESANLDMNYSYDGLHLSLNGTSHWRDLIKPYVDGNERPEPNVDPDIGSMMLERADTILNVPYDRVDIGNNNNCAEFIWTYSATDDVRWTELAQIRNGKLIDIYDTFPVVRTEENSDGAMALIDMTDFEPDDEFALCEINGNTLTAEGVLYPADE